MPAFREIFERVRLRPGMYFQQPTYNTVAAFVAGFDAACTGGVLVGFREWLIPKVGDGNNLAWPGLVLRLALPDAPDPARVVSSTAETEKHAIDVLFRSIFEFDDDRSKPHGLRRIYVDYEHWLRQQDWYNEKSPQWIDTRRK
jgi:hypothetical protein